jgi:ribosomal protein S18 acetylase RimI-like enzyme
MKRLRATTNTMKDFQIRVMTVDDIDFADSLRATAGWNQTKADWRRFIELAPQGCFIAESQGVRAGTATTISYQNKIAWIGMVLVDPERRRHGIGRGLLLHCIEHLRASGVQCIKLDATPLGKKLYDTLGFVDEWTLTRWRGNVTAAPNREFNQISISEIAKLDEAAFGVNRTDFLRRLAADSRTVFLSGEGFGMLRPGARAFYFGPVVAKSHAVGLRIMEALLPGGEIIVDIPDNNRAAVAWAQSLGLTAERQLHRMRLGPAIPQPAPETLFAIAAPEVG